MSTLFARLAIIPLVCGAPFSALAATAIDLSHQNPAVLTSLIARAPLSAGVSPILDLQVAKQARDVNNTLHVRVKQHYAGYPIFGSDAVIHIPHTPNTVTSRTLLTTAKSTPLTTMNGTVYQDVQKDLQASSPVVFTPAQAEKALTEALRIYQGEAGTKGQISRQATQLMVYVDDKQQAHWAYQIHFYVKNAGKKPALPTYIMDASSFSVYEQWDNIQSLDSVSAGGFGGNVKMGKLSYDGLPGHLSSLSVSRDAATQLCYLQNTGTKVANYTLDENKPISFPCSTPDKNHADLYWDGDRDHINGGYSPDHDALYSGKVINDLYQAWYGVPVLTKNGHPMVLAMVTHMLDPVDNSAFDNAFWDPEVEKMYFGDGASFFYPLTSLGVAAHEVSHGFTSQHADLVYKRQSGGMNEAFSDMAAQAAEVYAYGPGKNSWQIGPEIFKQDGLALRYMDKPSKDCGHNTPGNRCSIDDASQYRDTINVHNTSGVYNRAFYLLATSPNWDVRKAFNVMVKANQDYWVATSTFTQGACGVMKAGKDLSYDTAAIAKAFKTVGVSTENC